MTPFEVRAQLVDALRLDLVGPDHNVGMPDEVLPQAPSKWYLTGFLVPLDGDESQRVAEDANEALDAGAEPGGIDDADTPEAPAARKSYLPSSMGMSVLIAPEAKRLDVTVSWGDYRWQQPGDEKGTPTWHRTPREEPVAIDLPAAMATPEEVDVPKSDGLRVSWLVRPVAASGGVEGLPFGTRSMSIFLVNRRVPAPDEERDHAFAFQAALEVVCDEPLVDRPNARSMGSDDWDERVADLQYRDACELAVGHNVATETVPQSDGLCRRVRTYWIPQAEVERVAPPETIDGVTLSMDELAGLTGPADAQTKLSQLVTEYRSWIDSQESALKGLSPRRLEIAKQLLQRACHAATRIGDGIDLLNDASCLEAFRIANGVMAHAARQRLAVMAGTDPATLQPKWRPFQLAFLLMNLRGIADPTHADRSAVDLLFFPTGGGKTEAYLGLAAFTLVLRRLRNPGIASAGLAVLMRYTLRLLTLDQLSRAATLICALELEREKDVNKLGEWPFEIGLWVGKAATPNVMGRKGDNNPDSARAKTIAYKNNDSKPAPIPIEECPWCGTKFKNTSFDLRPNPDEPSDLRVRCVNRRCDFSRERSLPLLAVDEPIYRRLPCFLIATVDKFAAMPWTGEVGQFFGRVDRHDAGGFYGPCRTGVGRPIPGGRLLPPDLVIQDELHLISGPLGTIAGLYEAALDELCCRELNGKKVRPKIVASTATVRRAENQIRALFNRATVDIFPPPTGNRRDSFFAQVHSPEQSNARLYVGVAAQGRSPKVILLRAYLALLSAVQKAYDENGGKKNPANPADPYMTLLGYFNSLRELGGTRRIVEDEVGSRLQSYGGRKRVGEAAGAFKDRKIAYEVVELTSRVSTDKVAEAKARLNKSFDDGDKAWVDVALATNMISVGLDIVRLGLMVVFAQPKTCAEYIQATSRVGRDHTRPGLVVAILNAHRPRDRSHFERFACYHESFYRNVEATSVTPFSPRALDRALVGSLVALARQGNPAMTPPRGAAEILKEREKLKFAIDSLAERARGHAKRDPEEMKKIEQEVKDRATGLLDDWAKIAVEFGEANTGLQYNPSEAGAARPLLHTFLDPELKMLPARQKQFRANRSMRDVEPSVNLWLKTLDNVDIEEDEE